MQQSKDPKNQNKNKPIALVARNSVPVSVDQCLCEQVANWVCVSGQK